MGTSIETLSSRKNDCVIHIVDDNPDDRAAVRLYLSEPGLEEGMKFRFRESGKGKQALAACRSEPPDCILLDYYLPDMDGLEFLTRLKQDSGEIPVPVVMLTGTASKSLAVAALRAGAQEYLPKRFMGSEMLLRAVQSAQDRFVQLANRRRTEAALAASEEMLRLSQEAAQIASYEQDLRSGEIHWASGSQVLIGLPPAQATMTHWSWRALCHPADAARIDAERAAAFAQHAARAVHQFRICRPDTGAVRQVEVRVRIEYDGAGQPRRCNAAVADVTEQRAADQALRTSEARLSAVFDGTLSFMALLAPDGTLLKANRSSLEFLGVAAESVIGRPFWDTMQCSFAARLRLREAIAEAALGEIVHCEVEHERAGGRVLPVYLSFCPVRDVAGSVVFVVSEWRAVTERLRGERALAGNHESPCA